MYAFKQGLQAADSSSPETKGADSPVSVLRVEQRLVDPCYAPIMETRRSMGKAQAEYSDCLQASCSTRGKARQPRLDVEDDSASPRGQECHWLIGLWCVDNKAAAFDSAISTIPSGLGTATTRTCPSISSPRLRVPAKLRSASTRCRRAPGHLCSGNGSSVSLCCCSRGHVGERAWSKQAFSSQSHSHGGILPQCPGPDCHGQGDYGVSERAHDPRGGKDLGLVAGLARLFWLVGHGISFDVKSWERENP